MPPKRKVESTDADAASPRRSTRHANTGDNGTKASKEAAPSSKIAKSEPKNEVKEDRTDKKDQERDEKEITKEEVVVEQESDVVEKQNKGKDSGEPMDTKAEENESSGGVSKKPLNVGDLIPSVALLDSQSNEVSLLAESSNGPDTKGLVLFSYPAASTPGCTSQACSYRDAYEEISKLGYGVFGISTDTPAAQEKFKMKHGFKYPLLSDPKKLILGPLGGSLASKKTALRCHWVIKRGGEIVSIEIGVKPKDCVTKALKTIDSLK